MSLCDPVDRSPLGSSVHEILQDRILEWAAILSSRREGRSRGSSQLRDQTHISCGFCIAGEFLTAEPPEKPIHRHTDTHTDTHTHTFSKYIILKEIAIYKKKKNEGKRRKVVFFLSPPPSLWVEPSCLPACISHKCPTLVNCFPLCHSASLFSSEILLYEWNIVNRIINLKKSILAIGGLSCWQKQYLYCCCSGVTPCPTL